MTKIMLVVGTRPEAIKLAPVYHALRNSGAEPLICLTSQHPELGRSALRYFDITPDIELPRFRWHSLDQLTARLLTGIGKALDASPVDRVFVQGDTCSALAGALAAHHRRIPVAHVEAGLRSGDLSRPWPEEANRRMIATLADLHFAPTSKAAAALIAENVPAAAVHKTGNTGIDALLAIRGALPPKTEPIAGGCRRILVTCHRRESFGAGVAEVVAALRALASRSDVEIVLPVHPNPRVAGPIRAGLRDIERIALTEPLDYPDFVRLLASADLVLTDSGGVQEEAPALGKPVLVLREVTERTEGVDAGNAKLVGTRARRIVEEACNLLDDADAYARMARAHSPYGDGRAAQRIAAIVTATHGLARLAS